ncbi:DEKNAAC103839 [Brettanomyces naardenensis]|uniref:DEKNAAC103839 n=1 Tax=Brettanomyces naardenensis TaxID=13370 RepID=A0A448YP98_BRENA|nr:DEKNAAC103839 [Brettanomyces naardenensis]
MSWSNEGWSRSWSNEWWPRSNEAGRCRTRRGSRSRGQMRAGRGRGQMSGGRGQMSSSRGQRGSRFTTSRGGARVFRTFGCCLTSCRNAVVVVGHSMGISLLAEASFNYVRFWGTVIIVILVTLTAECSLSAGRLLVEECTLLASDIHIDAFTVIAYEEVRIVNTVTEFSAIKAFACVLPGDLLLSKLTFVATGRIRQFTGVITFSISRVREWQTLRNASYEKDLKVAELHIL